MLAILPKMWVWRNKGSSNMPSAESEGVGAHAVGTLCRGSCGAVSRSGLGSAFRPRLHPGTMQVHRWSGRMQSGLTPRVHHGSWKASGSSAAHRTARHQHPYLPLGRITIFFPGESPFSIPMWRYVLFGVRFQMFDPPAVQKLHRLCSPHQFHQCEILSVPVVEADWTSGGRENIL